MVVHFLSQGQEIQKDNSDKNITFFNKNELSSILSFYGKKVSQGLLSVQFSHFMARKLVRAF